MTDDAPIDTIDLLRTDHADLRDLFAEYDTLIADEADAEDRLVLATAICDALTAHATAEEELFYPAVRRVIAPVDLVDEAEIEHAGVRALIERIQAMDPDDAGFDDAMQVLAQAFEHHVREEEEALFPRVRASGLDLAALGGQIARRRAEVLDELGAAHG